jgi:hypothetical protein
MFTEGRQSRTTPSPAHTNRRGKLAPHKERAQAAPPCSHRQRRNAATEWVAARKRAGKKATPKAKAAHPFFAVVTVVTFQEKKEKDDFLSLKKTILPE